MSDQKPKQEPKSIRLSKLCTELHLGTQKISVDNYSTGPRISIIAAQSLPLDKVESLYFLLQYILEKNHRLNAQ